MQRCITQHLYAVDASLARLSVPCYVVVTDFIRVYGVLLNPTYDMLYRMYLPTGVHMAPGTEQPLLPFSNQLGKTSDIESPR